MDKLILEVFRHMRAMWRYRRLGLICAWIVALLTVGLIFSTPKKFVASARIFVNTDSILKPLMAGMTVQPDSGQRIALLSRMVISRPNVEQLVKDTGLEAKAKTTEQRERLIDDVIDVLTIEGVGGDKSNIYLLKYRDTVPERAKHMIELLVAKFIESSQGGRTTDTEAAKQFLDEQADSYEKKLLEAEGRLKEFKLQNMGMVSPDGKDYISQMTFVKDQLSQAQLQLREAENSREAYRKGLAGEDIAAAPAIGTNAAGESIGDIDIRIEAMKRNLDTLLQKYTEGHPDVTGTRRVLKELNDQRRQLVEEHRKTGVPLTAPAALTGPRASEQLKVSLAQAEASVASLRARVSEYAGRYNQLREIALRMPEYEAQLAQLNRDYQINKKNYDDLAARRESASISSDMQSVSGVGDFRLIDPPRVAPAVATSRSVLLLIGLIFSLAAGLGVMFLAKEVRARVYDRSQLSEVAGLPILGVISIVDNERLKREEKLRLRYFTLTAFALFCLYLGVVAAGFLLTKPAA
ncbi:hypothetical protein BH11PSE11_BH11PSE11_36660 [soil metagenome]